MGPGKAAAEPKHGEPRPRTASHVPESQEPGHPIYRQRATRTLIPRVALWQGENVVTNVGATSGVENRKHRQNIRNTATLNTVTLNTAGVYHRQQQTAITVNTSQSQNPGFTDSC